jgi:hypothetical protein
VLVNKQEIVRASVKAGRRNQLALNIMDILFDSTTMCESTVNGTRDGKKRPLDASKVEAIRSYCFEKFPLAAGESKKEAVQKLTKSMTDKCTSLAKARELTN